MAKKFMTREAMKERSRQEVAAARAIREKTVPEEKQEEENGYSSLKADEVLAALESGVYTKEQIKELESARSKPRKSIMDAVSDES